MNQKINFLGIYSSYRPLAEATESQPGVTIEEIMQKMREREIEM